MAAGRQSQDIQKRHAAGAQECQSHTAEKLASIVISSKIWVDVDSEDEYEMHVYLPPAEHCRGAWPTVQPELPYSPFAIMTFRYGQRQPPGKELFLTMADLFLELISLLM